ncbi:MAG: tRNA epoxyqueuosine(34) reductase QueG [Thermomicrobiales bacterium]|nr:tRNA epoxyqueuosine(34) reductase QueG [Thermomicrobiales bacterium]
MKSLALTHGLEVAAISSADQFDGLADHLESHIAAGHVAGFDWFTPERARFSAAPRNLHPTARSIVSVGVPYWSGSAHPPDTIPRGRISRYAWGNDYHAVLKTRMRSLHAAIEAAAQRPVEARFLVDTARIVDRAAAARAGIGWYGKHSCLIVPGHGSWVMLGNLLLDLELDADEPIDKNCGRCSICLDRCPTGAIVAPYTIDSPRCLSFQTIEQRGPIPVPLRAALGNWVFGCDVCQDVCPYTGAAAMVNDPDFTPVSPERSFPRLDWLLAMSESEFRAVYRGSAVLRAKRRGLARNAAVALGNVGDDAALPTLIHALREHDEPLVRGHAAWAAGVIGGPAARLALDRARKDDPDLSVREEAARALEQR